MDSPITWWQKAVVHNMETQRIMLDLGLECFRLANHSLTGKQLDDDEEAFSTEIEINTIWGPLRLGYNRPEIPRTIKDINAQY